MTLEVSGGAGGVAARLADLRAYAGVLDRAGTEVRARADDVAAVALDESVLAAAVLCPAEAGTVGARVADASLTLVALGARMEGSALVLRATVETYEVLDTTQEQVMAALDRVGGYLLGRALPGLAVVAGAAVLGNPALVAALGRTVARDPGGALDEIQETLFENPWLMEEAAESLPWVVQGAADSLGGGVLLPWVLSGGAWPTGGYEESVGGLVALGNRLGLLEDTGEFTPTPVPGDHGPAPGSVAEIFEAQSALGAEESHGQVQISRVVGQDGATSWVVQVPGTQVWGPGRGDNPVDLTTSVHLMSGAATAVQREVTEAMHAAGVGPGEPVMLAGHSQGGMVAAAMAADPAVRAAFEVRSVVTGGAPIARFDIPDDVSVLALEHDQDAVAMLEGRENPDRPGWVTVERDLSGSGDLAATGAGLAAAHRTEVYTDTARSVDASQDPSLVAWREQNARFFSGVRSEVLRFALEPVR